MVCLWFLITQEEEGEVTDKKSWEEDCILRQSFTALVAAFDPRPGQTNISQIHDFPVPPPGQWSQHIYIILSQTIYTTNYIVIASP